MQEPSAAVLDAGVLPELNRRLDALEAQATARLQEQARAAMRTAEGTRPALDAVPPSFSQVP